MEPALSKVEGFRLRLVLLVPSAVEGSEVEGMTIHQDHLDEILASR